MRAPDVTILEGHVIDVLRKLPAASVHTVICSPPYWGLRDYARCGCATVAGSNWDESTLGGGTPVGQGTARGVGEPDPACPRCRGTGRDPGLDVVWDADPSCAHEWVAGLREWRGRAAAPEPGDAARTKRAVMDEHGRGQREEIGTEYATCGKCGAWRGQLGLEPTPDLYVGHILQVFREVRRVLRPDGTLWLNMGDCYTSTAQGTRNAPQFKGSRDYADVWANVRPFTGLKPKDLVGMPWRVAFALQADGWWLRSDPVWSKPNPMPESVDGWRWERHLLEERSVDGEGKVKRTRVRERETRRRMDFSGEIVEEARDGNEVPCPGCDLCSPNGGLVLRKDSWRPTKSHEYVFLMAPSDTYFADAEAVKEPPAESSLSRIAQSTFERQTGGPKDYGGYPFPSGWDVDGHGTKGFGRFSGVNPNRSVRKALVNFAKHSSGRNMRSVWTIPTEPYPEAHFATFPRKLVEPCVKAGTSEAGCCPECGAPWARVVDRESMPRRTVPPGGKQDLLAAQDSGRRIAQIRNSARAAGLGHDGYFKSPVTVGFRPTCTHGGDPVPCVVLDPFGGSGTVGEVARSLGRSAVLVEIKAEYVRLARERVDAAQRTLASFSGAPP